MKYISIADIFRGIVAKTSVAVMPKLQQYGCNFTDIAFFHGHYKEIQAELDRRKNSNVKYPLVGLFRDFPEQVGDTSIYSQPTLTLIIAHLTQQGYSSDEREQKVFKPILYPIYFELIRQIERSKDLDAGFQIQFTKIDHYFYGRDEGKDANVFNENTDSIEIRDLQVKIKINC